MNTNVVIGVLIATAVAAGLWITLGSDEVDTPADATAQNESAATNVESPNNINVDQSFVGKGSFIELMGLGQNLKCDFSYVSPETDGSVAGTVFVSGDKLRGDFEMQQADGTYYSHMIQTDETVYTWSETPEGTFAMKLPVNQSEAADDMPDMVSGPADHNRPVDLDNEVDYDCKAWSIDGAVFVPPSNIEFQDMQQMMDSIMQGFDPSLLNQ